MAEDLHVSSGGKAERYRVLLPQVRSLLAGETDRVANLANVAAALKTTFGFFWVGFYRVQGDELVLCTRIARGRGVCGTAWQEDRTLVVPDVDAFPGHIACSSLSRSEIVVPVHDREGRVRGVLDIDSDRPAAFDATDAAWLEELCMLLKD